jgi:D-alanyl-lipoteichoic acid acyltransferase DltB (MBOAT superfamily)
MYANLGKKVKKNLGLFATCVYISMGIFVVQVISYAFQKYVIEGTDMTSQIVMAIITMILWAIFLFVLFKISSPFRKFLLRMFGVDTDKSDDPVA